MRDLLLFCILAVLICIGIVLGSTHQMISDVLENNDIAYDAY